MKTEELDQVAKLLEDTARALRSKQLCGMPRFLAWVVLASFNEPKTLARLPEGLRSRAKELWENRT